MWNEMNCLASVSISVSIVTVKGYLLIQACVMFEKTAQLHDLPYNRIYWNVRDIFQAAEA